MWQACPGLKQFTKYSIYTVQLSCTMLIMCSNQIKFTSPDIFFAWAARFPIFPGHLGFSLPLLNISILLQCFPGLWVWEGAGFKSSKSLPFPGISSPTGM